MEEIKKYTNRTDKKILCKYGELLLLTIISFIFTTLVFDLPMILSGEIGCLSILGVKGLRVP